MNQFRTFLFWYWESESRNSDGQKIETYIKRKTKASTSATGNPFKFFDWFFEQEGFKSFIEYFKKYPNTFIADPTLTANLDTENLVWEIRHEPAEKELVEFTISFRDELQDLFTEEFEYSEYLLMEIEDEIAEVSKRKLSIKTYLEAAQQISVRNNKVPKIDTCYLPVLDKQYQEFANLIQHKIEVLTRSRTSKDWSRVKNNFGIKENKKNDSIIEAIHSLDFDGFSFIDRTKTDINLFKEFFYCNDLSKFKKQIHIQCQLQQAVHVIRKIKSTVFKTLQFSVIERSKAVMKSENDFIKAQDLHTAHIGAKYSSRFTNDVDSFFARLQKS